MLTHKTFQLGFFIFHMVFRITANVRVKIDNKDNTVTELEHNQQPYRIDTQKYLQPTPRIISSEYIRDVAAIYRIDPMMLTTLDENISEAKTLPEEIGLQGEGSKLRFAHEKTSIDEITVVSYAQTSLGIQIWQAGISTVLNNQNSSVISSKSSIHQNLRLKDPIPNSKYLPDKLTTELLTEMLIPTFTQQTTPEIKLNESHLLIYQYQPDSRVDDEKDELSSKCTHSIALAPVPMKIHPLIHYIVTEVLFSTTTTECGKINWRAFIEIETGTILYLRALSASATGFVFIRDPCSASGDISITPSSTTTLLDSFRTLVMLDGLVPTINNTNHVSLTGQFVRIVEIQDPLSSSPSEPLPGNFNYSVPTDNFAAVNAYYHSDFVFRMVENMGIDPKKYFDGTDFPVPVDHRALNNTVNAQAPGNIRGDGSDGFRFSLIETGKSIGISVDIRVVLHEFGHVLLWDNLHSPKFGFAHSVGDSLAAILSDPESLAPDRFLTFPWVGMLSERRHDRKVSDGWGWGGPWDIGGYEGEQILSTTLFRIYRSIGGDSGRLESRLFSARLMAYLIIRAIGSLSPNSVTPTDTPEIFATALINADFTIKNFEGYPGSALHKVIRWGFEKQGLYQPQRAKSADVNMEGAPPEVDVYIDDGRRGEYYYIDLSETTDIINRNFPDGIPVHQNPLAGKANFMYVRVNNRGTRPAIGVSINVYQSNNLYNSTWPDDWHPIIEFEHNVRVCTGESILVGPVEWIPFSVGTQQLLVTVGTDGDLPNTKIIRGSIPLQALKLLDNNIGLRTITITSATSS